MVGTCKYGLNSYVLQSLGDLSVLDEVGHTPRSLSMLDEVGHTLGSLSMLDEVGQSLGSLSC